MRSRSLLVATIAATGLVVLLVQSAGITAGASAPTSMAGAVSQMHLQRLQIDPARHTVEPHAYETRGPEGQPVDYTTNWSGYVAPSGTFKYVTSTFVQP
ncbi:MAG TPA: hypothetical protein VEJ87_14950, partial [Acidimicrobiales bacterium]|nr:hypothetical protein [Acidimicrobiales bacterium]